MIRASLFATAASIALIGCTMQDAPETTPTPGQCNAAPAQALVGQPADEVQLRARELSGAATVRTYKQGDPVTMDYREDRLNLVVNDANVILEVKCG